MTSGVAQRIDRAEELFIGLPDDDFTSTMSHVLNLRTGFDPAVRDAMLSLLQVNGSANGIRSSAQGMAQAVANTLRPSEFAEHARQMLRIEGEARAAVLRHDMLTATEVAQALAVVGTNRREIASRLRRAGNIVGVRSGQRYVYPAFQFDRRAGSVRPAVVAANQQLGADTDPWGVASFWLSPSGRLESGRSPADLAIAGDEATLRDLVADVLDRD